MDLLPKVNQDFSSKKYWDRFFTNRKDTFEWYGNYLELCGLLYRYVNKKDKILVPGCGNSKLSQDLYDSGFTNIVNIDLSKTVIRQMKAINKNRPEMEWIEMNIHKADFADSSFSVVLDKGTLDAMMSSDEGTENIESMFEQIHRILRIGGRYLVISLSQDHVLKTILNYFPKNNWLLRIHKVWVNTEGDKDRKTPNMPLFMFVLTKFANMKNKIIEICLDDSEKPKRLQSEDAARELIKSQQYFAMVKNDLNYNDAGVDVPPIELFTSDKVDQPRYRIRVLDIDVCDRKFGVFIIPHGREHDWLFATKQGEVMLAQGAGYSRLLMVALNRHHDYKRKESDGGMGIIQAELSSRVMELAPHGLSKNYKTPFLSSGQLGERYVRADFLHLNNRFIVEDYKASNDNVNYWCRRVVCERHERLPKITLLSAVTAEMVLFEPNTPNIASARSNGRRNKNGRIDKLREKRRQEIKKIDHSKIYHEHVQATIAFISQIVLNTDGKAEILYLGLASNVGLISNIQEYFPDTKTTLVETDENFIQIAKEFCGLNTEKIKIYNENTKSFLHTVQDDENATHKYDVIVTETYLDEDLKPIDPLYLVKMKSKLSEQGMLVLTLASSKDIDISNTQEGRLSSIFDQTKSLFPTVNIFWARNNSRLSIFCQMQKKKGNCLVSMEAMKKYRSNLLMDPDKLFGLVNFCVSL